MTVNQANKWISLKTELPSPGETVFWYDAMFDNIMYFALDEPATHDGDFSHFARQTPMGRPDEIDLSFGHKEVGFYTEKQRFSWSWVTEQGIDKLFSPVQQHNFMIHHIHLLDLEAEDIRTLYTRAALPQVRHKIEYTIVSADPVTVHLLAIQAPTAMITPMATIHKEAIDLFTPFVKGRQLFVTAMPYNNPDNRDN